MAETYLFSDFKSCLWVQLLKSHIQKEGLFKKLDFGQSRDEHLYSTKQGDIDF